MPASAAERRFIDGLGQLLDRRARREADLRPSRVLGRNQEDGTLRLQRLDAECVARGDTRPAQEGQVLTLPSGPAFESRGAAGVQGATLSAEARMLWVESLDPDELPQGETTQVLVTGRGFRAGVLFDFGLPGTEEVHPDITVLTITLIDSEQVLLEVDVAADAERVRDAPLFYDVPGLPF